MLMTVLKGDLATQQSKALIRTFRAMKDYIVQNQSLITQRDYLRLSMQVSDTQQVVQGIRCGNSEISGESCSCVEVRKIQAGSTG